jgi:transcriptional antiterminator NusG
MSNETPATPAPEQVAAPVAPGQPAAPAEQAAVEQVAAEQAAAPQVAAEQPAVPADAQWFALHTLSGQEQKVKTYIEKFKKAEELDNYIFEVLLPTETVTEVKNGRKKSIVRKLYPGYVFIQMRLFEDGQLINRPWYFVREVAGVIDFVSGGDTPTALRPYEIEEIKARIAEGAGKEVPKVVFEVGENVKVTDGAFANLTGRIDDIDPDRGKLKISVSIFGRFTPVELEYWQVQRITE